MLVLLTATTLSGCGTLSLYPEGPVVSEYKCSPPTPEPRDEVQTSNGDLNASASGTKLDGQTNASSPLKHAVILAKNTRDNYGKFLRCGERRQIVIGAAAVGLAAGALGLAGAGINADTAAGLGAGAGSLLGLDYVIYNRKKASAYAHAAAQLQCVIEKGEAVETMAANNGNSYRLQAIKKVLEAAGPPAGCENAPEWQAVSARKSLLDGRRKDYEKWNDDLPHSAAESILSARRMIDAHAFAAAQDGVPDASELKSAVEAISIAIPKKPESTDDSGSGDTKTKTIKVIGLGNAEPPEPKNCGPENFDNALKGKLEALSAAEDALADMKHPKIDFQVCLAGGASADEADSQEGGAGKEESNLSAVTVRR